MFFYYSSIIIVSFLFSSVPSLAADCKKVQKLWHVVQKTDSVLGQKNSNKITRSSFWSEVFWQRALYNWLSSVCSELFYLSCRSAPKKIFTTCWSVFHRFCPVLPFLRFANLELAFSLQKNLLAILRNSSSARLSLFPVGKKLFYCGY